MRQPVSSSSCVAGDVFIETGAFGMDALEIKSLMLGTYVKEKLIARHLTTVPTRF